MSNARRRWLGRWPLLGAAGLAGSSMAAAAATGAAAPTGAVAATGGPAARGAVAAAVELPVAGEAVAEAQRKPLLAARLLTVFGQWQREGEVMHLLAVKMIDHSELLQGLAAKSRNFR